MYLAFSCLVIPHRPFYRILLLTVVEKHPVAVRIIEENNIVVVLHFLHHHYDIIQMRTDKKKLSGPFTI